MKEIITIIVRLTVSCLLAAAVMGICFIFTSNAKKHNEHVKEQQVMYELLGYKGDVTIPDTVALHEIYRYVISMADKQLIAYLVPGEHGEDFQLVEIDLDGHFVAALPVKMSEQEVVAGELRDKVVQGAVGPSVDVKFADQTVVVTDKGRRIAYLVNGKFQGFKTFVSVMLAVDPDFTMLGLEILEHEEDPGLGAEIEKDYFKNQFRGKPFATLKNIGVVKEPIPEDYLKALNGKTDKEDILKVQEMYKDKDIYALTGATISSRAVSNGVKGIVKKFAYRISVLDKVLGEQKLAVPF